MVSMVFFLKMLKIILLKIGTFKIHLAQQKGKGNRVSKEKAMRPPLSLSYKSILGVNKGTASNRLIMPTSFFEKVVHLFINLIGRITERKKRREGERESEGERGKVREGERINK